MQDRLQSQVALRAKLVAEQAFGDVRRASATLRRLADVLDGIGEVIDETGSPDQVARTDTNDQEATPKRARRTRSERPRET